MASSSVFATTDRCRRHDRLMRAGTDGDGRTVWTCEYCERNQAGICMDCPRPLPMSRRGRGSAKRCAVCRLREERRREQERAQRRVVENRMRMRAHRAKPEVRERRKIEARDWRKTHPRTDADRLVARVKMRHRRQQRRKAA